MPGWIKKWTRPRDLSLSEKQALTKSQLQGMTSDLFQDMLKVYVNGMKLVSNNAYGLTSQEVIAGLGDDAVELMRLATLLKDCINIAEPGTITDTDPYGGLLLGKKK